MWFFLFLTFVIKVGQVYPLLFTDFTNYTILKYSENLDLPQASTSTELHDKRYINFIVVDNHGKYKLEGKPISIEKLKEVLKRSREIIENFQILEVEADYHISLVWGTDNIFGLIVDKDCEMQYVKDVLALLKDNGFRKVYFITKKNT